MKLKIRFPGSLMPLRKPNYLSNLPPNIPKERNQTGFIIALLILWLVIFIISLTKCKAQDASGLKIGDRVPDVTINRIINYRNSAAKLSDFKGELLILDFWATWCSSCISVFPKLYTLQMKFPGQLQVFLVNCSSTRDTEERIKSFLSQREQYYHFPTVIQDTSLEQLFPHHTIPHYIWIKDQVVVAITDASEVNEQNIKRLSADSKVNLAEKTFIRYDINKPLFEGGNGGDPAPLIYRSLLTGYKHGLQQYLGFHYNDQGLVDRIDVLNSSKMGLIKFAWPQFAAFSTDRIIINAADPDSFSTDSTSIGWKEKNCFCYESIFPACPRREALALTQSDIQKYFRVQIDSVAHASNCFILTVDDSSKIVRAAAGKRPESNINDQTGAPIYFLNFSLKSISRYLENGYRTPFVNESGLSERVNLNLPANYKDERELSASFLKQGFKLIKGKRNITYLVVSDQSFPQSNLNNSILNNP